ncbi:MAG TPA: acyltransferase family protein [Thermomicrobiales bacterium]|nr:acyltransferase family protein [Thermomicrobiales bacterium]
MRAIAVLLVVTYHVWFNRVSGGVDVFFVISGFLLTAQLARAADRGAIDLGKRWSRTFVRILPPSVVVLVATVIAAYLVMPESQWRGTIREIVASGFLLENWQLVANSVDYAASNDQASVVQHFWSLSIQGQFFIVWPILVAAVAATGRRLPGSIRWYLAGTIGLVFAGSLLYSIHLTDVAQPVAYFHSATRAWEFAFGGLLALGIDRIRLPRRLAVPVGWLGVIGLLLCGVLIDAGQVFPGFLALWPATCAALILIAGTTGVRGAADGLLSSRPMAWVGDLSFSLYLWHWPVLIIYLVQTGRTTVELIDGLVLIAISVLLAMGTRALVEQPLARRPWSTLAGYRLIAASLVTVVAVAGAWEHQAEQRVRISLEAPALSHPGAPALGSAPMATETPVPAAVSLREDWVPVREWDCVPLTRFAADRCTQVVSEEPTRRVVVVGDSHIQQLGGALVPIAEARGWQLTFILRGACPFSTTSEVNPDDRDCVDWNAAVAAEILDLSPDIVVTLATRNVREGLTETTPTGFVEQWRLLDGSGISVVAIRDNPRFDYSVPECVERSSGDGEECGIAREAVYSADPPWHYVNDLPANVRFLDVADLLCDPEWCSPVIGNVFVYMDDNHLTATYTLTMSGPLEPTLIELIEG